MKQVLIIIIIIITGLIVFACQKKETNNQTENLTGSLKLANSYQINIPEPSGVSFGHDKQTLLIVSDNTNMVYETNFQGEIIRTLNYEGADLEGVVYNPNENIVAVAEERLREIVFLDYEEGNKISGFHININSENENKGLEGISYNINNKAYYIVNKDLPRELIVWNPMDDIIEKTELRFADDYSAIFVDNENSLLWIVSDESKTLYKCDYKANVIMEFPLPNTKYEGVIVDTDNKKVFLVNDATARLEIFNIEE